MAVSYTVLGAIRESLGETGAAKRMQEQALAHFRQSKDRPGEASALINIGNLLLQNDPLVAIEYFKQGGALAREHGLKEAEFKDLFGLALAERRRKNLISSKRWSTEALALADSLDPDALSRDELTTPYERLRQDCYRLLIDLLIKTPASSTSEEDLAEAFEMIESRRQHNLWSSLTPARVREGTIRRAEPSLRAERQKLEEEISHTEKERRRLESEGAPTKAVTDDLKALLEKLQTLDSQIRFNDPWVTSADRPALAALKEAQAMLEENETLLEFELGETRSFLLRVTSSSMNVYELPSRDEIEAAFQEFYDNISKSQSSVDLRKARAQAIKLGRMLLGPVAGELGTDTIIVVPDGRLHALPFHILPDPAGEDPKWKNPWPTPLLFRHVVAYLPSVSVLKAVRSEFARRSAPDRLLAVFAAPVFAEKEFRHLPHSHKEAERILARFPPHLRFSAQGRKATRDLARSGFLEDYRYIHFATHAANHPSHPELASIILSQEDANGKHINGRLSQLEIQDLRLKADLVVLSACKTALGNQTPGEGVVGLSQGFLYAGAASVAASLWNINDESTSAFMASFYDALINRGQPPAQALNTAQIWMAQEKHQKESWSSPYHWGAFQLHGEWR